MIRIAVAAAYHAICSTLPRTRLCCPRSVVHVEAAVLDACEPAVHPLSDATDGPPEARSRDPDHPRRISALDVVSSASFRGSEADVRNAEPAWPGKAEIWPLQTKPAHFCPLSNLVRFRMEPLE